MQRCPVRTNPIHVSRSSNLRATGLLPRQNFQARVHVKSSDSNRFSALKSWIHFPRIDNCPVHGATRAMRFFELLRIDSKTSNT